jgi:hypothetical protein
VKKKITEVRGGQRQKLEKRRGSEAKFVLAMGSGPEWERKLLWGLLGGAVGRFNGYWYPWVAYRGVAPLKLSRRQWHTVYEIMQKKALVRGGLGGGSEGCSSSVNTPEG